LSTADGDFLLLKKTYVLNALMSVSPYRLKRNAEQLSRLATGLKRVGFRDCEWQQFPVD
jgi:hypothetical protein